MHSNNIYIDSDILLGLYLTIPYNIFIKKYAAIRKAAKLEAIFINIFVPVMAAIMNKDIHNRLKIVSIALCNAFIILILILKYP